TVRLGRRRPNESLFLFSSRRRHTRSKRDWSSDVCSSDLKLPTYARPVPVQHGGQRVGCDSFRYRGKLHHHSSRLLTLGATPTVPQNRPTREPNSRIRDPIPRRNDGTGRTTGTHRTATGALRNSQFVP